MADHESRGRSSDLNEKVSHPSVCSCHIFVLVSQLEEYQETLNLQMQIYSCVDPGVWELLPLHLMKE